MAAKQNSTKRAAAEFATEVAKLMRLKGYRVRDGDNDLNEIATLVASKDDLIQKNTINMFCVDRATKIDEELVTYIANIKSEKNDVVLKLIISRLGFTDSAIQAAETFQNVSLKSFLELQSELINFAPYIDWYVQSYELAEDIFKAADLYHRYIELYCTDTSNTKRSLSLVASDWLADVKNNIFFVLGEYGSGKTSFCRTFTYQLLKKHGDKPYPLPILINLRQYRNSYNIQQMITDSLINYYGVSIASFTAIERMCNAGRLLFVLDGFDEMADQSDTRTIAECFRQLFILAELRAKLLITCRTNFFRSHEEIVDLLRTFKVRSTPTDQSIDFSKHGKIIYIEPLDEPQIAKFINKRDGNGSLLKEIKNIHDLTDLSSRPVLLDMIVETLPQLRKDRFVNSAALYEEYTAKWTLRDEWRVILPREVRSLFCEEIAWWMHRRGSQALPYKFLETLVTDTFSNLSGHKNDISRFLNDVQTCSFLTRATGTDDFRFAHKSFTEYFVARTIIKGLVSKRNLSESNTLDDEHVGGLALKKLALWPEQTNLRSLLASQLGALLSHEEFALRSNWRDRLLPRVKRMTAGSGAEALSNSIRELLERKNPPASSPLRISEEIATFAMEHALNKNLSMERISGGARASGQNNVLADLLRLSRSREFSEANISWLRERVINEEDNSLIIGCVVALIRSATMLDLELAKKIRSRISHESWTYLLYECMSEGDSYHSFLRACFALPDARLIDRVICHYGSRTSLPDSGAELDERLLEELLASGEIDQVELGLRIVEINTLSSAQAIRLFTSLTDRNPDLDRTIYLNLLGDMDTKKLVAMVRSALTKNPSKKERLQTLERLALDRRSLEREGKIRTSISKEACRELLWRSIRP